ncbi:hypothetical protein RPMA_06565 [Tardiphaga alba]|uniref:Uncharacterized protein n=1 Tax=Tardiphaga alba TaxID=340268 RepID=A0ABX8A4I6_9BRAD|nr:hypothetical protein [Tardiphaga alba]QUS38533.1 hypothetical protein RPMA_06565 [Tardiphaga alba]
MTASYDPDTIALMREVLHKVVAKVPPQHRTSTNQAAIACRILATAAQGLRSEEAMTQQALAEVKDIFNGPAGMKQLHQDLSKVFG